MWAGSGTSGGGEDAGNQQFGINEVIARARHRDLASLYTYWEGGTNGGPPDDEELMRDRIAAWMVDGALVEARLGELGQRLGSVMENLIGAQDFQVSFEQLEGAKSLARLSKYDLEACLAALVQRGLLLRGDDRRFESLGQPVYGVPRELAGALEETRRQKLRGVFGQLTLRGHLEQEYSSPERAARITPQRLRALYKVYSQEAACTSRIERLPDGVRELLEKAVLEFGGILPKQLFERMETNLPHWNPKRWSMILEKSLVGTVCELNLQRYGINMRDETFVVFNEVSLAWLRRVAVPGDPDRPHEELSLGIDLVTNVSRFLSYVDDNGVRFTSRGEIFKTTEKKIRQFLIPNPGRELSREEVLRFIFRFCKRRGLIDRTAKRTFRVTDDGHAWGSRALLKKQQEILEFMVEERPEERVLFHQRQMRRIFLSMLKRIEPDTWYDLMYLPFLARNNYLSTLDELNVEGHFTERTESGNFQMLEDVQRLAWNLVRWARQRLYLLGMLDIGYDKQGHPVAMRLTRAATRLLGVDRIGPCIPNAMGSLVVMPDFEVVLFPTGDDVELIHDLDRFCERGKGDSLQHFRITQSGIVRALRDGMGLERIERVLENNSRTPVAQNVAFSVRSWAQSAGLMRLDDELRLVAGDPEMLKTFLQDSGTRKYVLEAIDDCTLQMGGAASSKRLRTLLSGLGYLVECGPPLTSLPLE